MVKFKFKHVVYNMEQSLSPELFILCQWILKISIKGRKRRGAFIFIIYHEKYLQIGFREAIKADTLEYIEPFSFSTDIKEIDVKELKRG